jgi:hypothetical protein
MKNVVIGVKTRTGRATAVVLSEPATSPQFVCREELALSDKAVPATMQPYHEVMELPWSESMVAVRPTIAAIEKIAAASLRKLIAALESRGFRVACVALVGPADRKLERIGNPHIRAHAAEGVLFRAVVESAAKANRVEWKAFVDPARELSAPQKKKIDDMKKIAGAPWRGEEKTAAMAAWAALTPPRRSSAR